MGEARRARWKDCARTRGSGLSKNLRARPGVSRIQANRELQMAKQEKRRPKVKQDARRGKPQAEIGIIGGSGLYSMPGLEKVREVRVATPFGSPSDAFVLGELEGRRVAFLARHG